MSDLVADQARPASGEDGHVIARLSTLDRFLPLWIIAAMALGLGLGRLIPSLAGDLDTVKVGSVSLLVALVYVALWPRRRYYSVVAASPAQPTGPFS